MKLDIPLEASCLRKGLFCVAVAIAVLLFNRPKLFGKSSRDQIEVIDKHGRAEYPSMPSKGHSKSLLPHYLLMDQLVRSMHESVKLLESL